MGTQRHVDCIALGKALVSLLGPEIVLLFCNCYMQLVAVNVLDLEILYYCFNFQFWASATSLL